LLAPFLLLLLLHPTAPILLPFPTQQQEKDKQQEGEGEEEADNVLLKGQEFSFWICLQENEQMGGWALAGPSSSCTSLVLVHDIVFYPLHFSRYNRRKELLLLPVLL
jgi:hypothetical protein